MNNYSNIDAWTTRQSGFSLLEVLMAVAVLSIGLLGLARMQATGLINSQGAYHSSQATVLAYDLADKMRANTTSINNYLTTFMTLPAATVAGEQSGCISTTGCTTAQLAINDLRDWHTNLKAALPSPTGTITLVDTTYTITVNWDENRDGSVNDSDPNFQVSFQP